MQQEAIVRVIAADLVDHEALLEGLRPLEDELDRADADIARALEVARSLPERRRVLEINHRYAARLIALQREWLDEVRAELS
jgi:hypothetical protein